MTHQMLLVVTTLLLSGCCTGFLCELREMERLERQWEGSRDAARQLWENERHRTRQSPTGLMLPDTTEAHSTEPPDSRRR